MKHTIFALVVFFSITSQAQKTDADFSAAIKKENMLPQANTTSNISPQKQFQQFLKQANTGNVKAMYLTGKNYKYGNGVMQNSAEALRWLSKAAAANYPPANFTLGEMYKFGDLLPMDYQKSYECFSKAADSAYVPAFYSKAYMLHKGLGCSQDYAQALLFFKKGAYNNYAPAMYMLGITYRNGYGTIVNADSATYWLKRSADKGYKFASDELTTAVPENNPTAIDLVKKIEEAKKHIAPKTNPINQYTKIATGIPANELDGNYKGYLIKYDWSGKQIIDVSALSLKLSYINQKITGYWSEADSSLNLPFTALLTKNGLLFQNMQYRKADHYSMGNRMQYNFQKASLQLIKDNNTFYLSGNLNLYSPETKEPEKPFSIVLVRTSKDNSNEEISFVNEDGSALKTKDNLKAYPNPFKDVVNIEFNLKKQSKVYTQLFSIDGKPVYTTPAAVLEAGNYILPLRPNAAAGTYILKLIAGNEVKTTKLIKL